MSGSIFTLSFAVELTNVEATLEGTNQDILELQNYADGYKITYDLYPGISKELNILVWPQCAKVLSSDGGCWVRTWSHQGHSWAAVSIRHLVPARVQHFLGYTVSAVPAGSAALSAGAKSIKGGEVSFPSLKFNERYNFGGVIDVAEGENVESFIVQTIWSCIEDRIPTTKYDVVYDVPEPVTDIRHQDAILDCVERYEQRQRSLTALSQLFSKTDKKGSDGKEKKGNDVKYELSATGDVIMAGAGRVISLRTSGTPPKDLDGVGIFISTLFLPTEDDLPIIFVSIDHLLQTPVEELLKARLSHVYTRWQLGEEQHCSALHDLSPTVNVDDHHVVVLTHDIGWTVISGFMEKPFEIELRGVREKTAPILEASLYGTTPKAKLNRTTPHVEEELDVLIGLFQIDAERIAKGFNTLIKGEFGISLPTTNFSTSRQQLCTNEINSIGVEYKPPSCIPSYVLFDVPMTLEVAMGFVGCRPHGGAVEYSRLYFLLENEESIDILRHVNSVNEALLDMDKRDDILTGFAVDSGHHMFAIIEGKKDGKILGTLQMATDSYPKAQIVFSTVAKYPRKVYCDTITGNVPFKVFKMSISLSILVACPMLYVRPAVPLPARAAVLKLHRLIAGGLAAAPALGQLPTIHELRSFRLEFCAPPKREGAPERLATRKDESKEGRITWGKVFNRSQQYYYQ